MKVEFIYPRYYDLVLHVLAHFKVNNASDLYDEGYIAKMSEARGRENPAIYALQDYYNENYERLMLINFLPYYCNSYEEMKQNFLSCKRFTAEDLRLFIKPFIEVLDNESAFFFDYWDAEHAKLSKPEVEKYFAAALEKFSCLVEYFNKPCRVLFSLVITKNGRGFYSDTHFAALVKFPQDQALRENTFFQLLHEYTHSFTDELLQRSINMHDGSHNLSEEVVLYADFLLIKAVDKGLLPAYFEWVGQWYGDGLNEQDFAGMFGFDEKLNAEIDALINRSLSNA